MNGVTGRMGTNQHLVRSILAIREQGGLKVRDDLTLMPEPVLTGRNPDKLRRLAEEHGLPRWTTDLAGALKDPGNEIFFDASSTLHRVGFVEQAVRAGKAIYCEKPTATNTADALRLYELCARAGLKNGVVQDKLWLPGIRKLKRLIDQGFFGRILSVRAEFGYWVFTGENPGQPAQRPSWNYRKEEGGGILMDMLCHWRYLIDNLFGPVKSVCCLAAVHLPRRVDEQGRKYEGTAEDAAYTTVETANGIVCQFNSSWCVRVRRDDLLTLQVDGEQGSAVAGLRKCWTQSCAGTPKLVWNPDLEQPVDLFRGWKEESETAVYDNAFKAQWELFLRHVALGEPFPWTLKEGAKGVQLAEKGRESWRKRAWVQMEEL
jgi:predicted dehydrogenase